MKRKLLMGCTIMCISILIAACGEEKVEQQRDDKEFVKVSEKINYVEGDSTLYKDEIYYNEFGNKVNEKMYQYVNADIEELYHEFEYKYDEQQHLKTLVAKDFLNQYNEELSAINEYNDEGNIEKTIIEGDLISYNEWIIEYSQQQEYKTIEKLLLYDDVRSDEGDSYSYNCKNLLEEYEDGKLISKKYQRGIDYNMERTDLAYYQEYDDEGVITSGKIVVNDETCLDVDYTKENEDENVIKAVAQDGKYDDLEADGLYDNADSFFNIIVYYYDEYDNCIREEKYFDSELVVIQEYEYEEVTGKGETEFTETEIEEDNIEEKWDEEPYYIDPIVGKYISDSDNKLWLYDDNYAIYEEDGADSYGGKYQTLSDEEYILLFEDGSPDVQITKTEEGNLYATNGYGSEIFYKVEVGETSEIDFEDALGNETIAYEEAKFSDEERACLEWDEYGCLVLNDDSLRFYEDDNGEIENVQLLNFVHNYSVYGVKLKYTLEQADSILTKEGFCLMDEESGWYDYLKGDEMVRLYIPVDRIDSIDFGYSTFFGY